MSKPKLKLRKKIEKGDEKDLTWIISLDIIDNEKTSIIGIYKSPKVSIDDFMRVFENHIESHVKSDSKIICVGDMNINTARKSSSIVIEYLNTLKSYGLKQIMEDYTRVKGKSKSIIDHILTNVNGIKYIINKELNIGDHYVVEVFMNQKELLRCTEKKKYKCMVNYSKEKFIEKLETRGLKIDSDLSEMTSAIKSVSEEFLVEKTVNKKSKFWFSDKLAILKRDKNNLFMKYKIDNCDKTYEEFLKLSKEYRNQLRNAQSAAIQKKT